MSIGRRLNSLNLKLRTINPPINLTKKPTK